jgi:hypothetical protein
VVEQSTTCILKKVRVILKVTSMSSGPRSSHFIQTALFYAVIIVISDLFQGLAIAGGVAIKEPTALHGGDQFRIIFVTPGTIQGTSSDIATYNAFANSQAAGATYNGVVIHWSAIVSTDAKNARDNIGLTNSPVFMADGTQVATSANTIAGGLWWGDPLLAVPVQDLSGNTYSGTAWTGTCGIGTEFSSMPVSDLTNTHVLATWGTGNSTNITVRGVNYVNQAEVGQIGGGGYTWVSTGKVTLNTNAYQIYAISDVLTVVPEPSSFVVSGLGIFMIGFAQKFRRRNGILKIDA